MKRPAYPTSKTKRQRRRARAVKRAIAAQRKLRGMARTAARKASRQAEADLIAETERRLNRMCREKKRYAYEESAHQAAVETGKYVYECPNCAGFHLTSKPLPRPPRPRHA